MVTCINLLKYVITGNWRHVLQLVLKSIIALWVLTNHVTLVFLQTKQDFIYSLLQILKQQQEGLQHLIEIIKEDAADLQLIEQGIIKSLMK